MILIGLAIFIAIWLAVFRHLDPDDFRRARYRNSRWEDKGKEQGQEQGKDKHQRPAA